MGPWEAVIVAVATVAGLFFVVMGFRGLIESVENFSGRCASCGRTAALPLPPQTHQCWRCHHGAGWTARRLIERLQPRHDTAR